MSTSTTQRAAVAILATTAALWRQAGSSPPTQPPRGASAFNGQFARIAGTATASARKA